MTAKLAAALMSMAGLMLAACGPVGIKVKPAPHDGIQVCAHRLTQDQRQLGALEKAILEGFIYVRPRTLANSMADPELYALSDPDGTKKLAVYSSRENLVKSLGNGRYLKFRGEALRGFNAQSAVVLNPGLNSADTIEWEKGRFGQAADTTLPALPGDCVTR